MDIFRTEDIRSLVTAIPSQLKSAQQQSHLRGGQRGYGSRTDSGRCDGQIHLQIGVSTFVDEESQIRQTRTTTQSRSSRVCCTQMEAMTVTDRSELPCPVLLWGKSLSMPNLQSNQSQHHLPVGQHPLNVSQAPCGQPQLGRIVRSPDLDAYVIANVSSVSGHGHIVQGDEHHEQFRERHLRAHRREASRLAHYNNRSTITSREIQAAVRLLLHSPQNPFTASLCLPSVLITFGNFKRISFSKFVSNTLILNASVRNHYASHHFSEKMR
uniref:Uncharacterized protein n=1 Tax=Anopheles atroparvus TaxID=41427 RepID=A0AAG5D2U4_ANOAO